MAVYAISDLHLALSIDKPMDVFGNRWQNYMEKLKDKWENTVSKEDTVIIPGDVSWATYIEQAVEDFKFIHALPGRKIISKGNHDYWWTTINKLNIFLDANNFSSISFMHNNCFAVEEAVLCGTRGWDCPGDSNFNQEDKKIFNRELKRLELSLECAKKQDAKRIIVALHYPPFNSQNEPSLFLDTMSQYNVSLCIYGHIHGEGSKNRFEGKYKGIECKNISADFLEFIPYRLDI